MQLLEYLNYNSELERNTSFRLTSDDDLRHNILKIKIQRALKGTSKYPFFR